MPQRVRSALPIDLMNLLGTFIGDDYHYLKFELTPKGFLSHHRIFMQSRHNPRKKTKHFRYTRDFHIKHPLGGGVLLVWYSRRAHPRNRICVRERTTADCDKIWELMTRRYKTFLQ